VEDVAVDTELMLCVVSWRGEAFCIVADEAMEAREIVAYPDMGATIGEITEGADEPREPCSTVARSLRPAAIRRAPSLSASLADGMIEDTVDADEGVMVDPGVEYARSIPRLTIFSHLRFSCESSASCTAS
jgi:hypothetical protein